MKKFIDTTPYTFHAAPKPRPASAHPLHAAYERHNPCRRPDWRWRRAEYLAHAQQRLYKRRDDAWTRLAARWLMNRMPGSAAETIAVLTEAGQIRCGHDHRQLEVSARLLARQSAGQIADRIGCAKAVVEAFEALYFNVTDRLHSRSWVMLSVFGPRWISHDAPFTPKSAILALSYFGGPKIADLALAMFQAGQLTSESEHDLTTEDGRLSARLWMLFQLLTVPVDAAHTPSKLKKLLNLTWLMQDGGPIPPGDFRAVFDRELPVELLNAAVRNAGDSASQPRDLETAVAG